MIRFYVKIRTNSISLKRQIIFEILTRERIDSKFCDSNLQSTNENVGKLFDRKVEVSDRRS